MKRHWTVGAVAALVAAGVVGYVTGRARATGIPTTAPLTYSGVLTDLSGAPLTGSKGLVLQIWDQATGGTTPQCSVGPVVQTLVAGGFQLPLPDMCTTAIQAKADLWVEIFVDSVSLGRSKLGAVPYAVEAKHAETADVAKALGAGTISVGLTYLGNTDCVTSGVNNSTTDCTCPAGSFVVSGGAYAGDGTSTVLMESLPLSTTTWRTTCTNGTSLVACNNNRFLCARLGP